MNGSATPTSTASPRGAGSVWRLLAYGFAGCAALAAASVLPHVSHFQLTVFNLVSAIGLAAAALNISWNLSTFSLPMQAGVKTGLVLAVAAGGYHLPAEIRPAVRSFIPRAASGQAGCHWLPGWQLSDSTDIMARGGHLPPQAMGFTIGTPGQPGYLHGRLLVSPGVGCSDDGPTFPLFGGVNEWRAYFNIEPIDSIGPVNPDDYASFADQSMTTTRIFFNKGGPVETHDSLPIDLHAPAGATEVVRIEMDFNFHGNQATLKWSDD
jgi:hypothetical protein